MVIERSISALNSVGRNLTDGAMQGNWCIEGLSKNSPAVAALSFAALPGTEEPAELAKVFVDGMQVLENEEAKPDGFNDEAIENVADLFGKRKNISAIGYEAPGGCVVRASDVAIAHAVALDKKNKEARPEQYSAQGELCGELGQVTAHRSKHEFVIHDELDDRKIVCNFPEEKLHDVAGALTKRVAVFGTIKYKRKTHQPISIDVEGFETLRQDAELASLDAIREAIGDLPQGMSPADYVRGLRDGS